MALNDFIINPKDAQRILIGASGKKHNAGGAGRSTG